VLNLREKNTKLWSY